MPWLMSVLTAISHVIAGVYMAKPRLGRAETAAVWGGYGLLFLFFPLVVQRPVGFIITLLLQLVLLLFTAQGCWEEKCFFFLSYACAFTSLIAYYDIACLFWLTDHPALQTLFGVLLLLLLQGLLHGVLLPFFRLVSAYIEKGWHLFYLLLAVFLLLNFSQTIYPCTVTEMTRARIVVYMVSTVAFFGVYVVLFTSMKNLVYLSAQKRHRMYTELLQEQIHAQATEIAKARQVRHDQRHHYQHLLSLLNKGDSAAAKVYLQQYTETLDAAAPRRYCENKTVNTILIVYAQKAERWNVGLKIRALAEPELAVSGVDLVSMLGNMLENALHGAAESQAANPEIEMNIERKHGHWVLRCQNSCKRSLGFDDMPEQMQGIGVKSILDTAERYGGNCRFSAKDGLFSCIVILEV